MPIFINVEASNKEDLEGRYCYKMALFLIEYGLQPSEFEKLSFNKLNYLEQYLSVLVAEKNKKNRINL